MAIKTLNNGTQWVKAEYWKEKDLIGTYEITYKIDGLRVIRGNDGKVYSRDSKPYKHNLERFDFQDAEFFYKDWNTSVSILHTDEETIPITQDMFYELSQGNEDPRLVVGKVINPTVSVIKNLLKQALLLKHEGIVLRQLDSKKPNWIKVVPTRYADIRINKIIEGNGKLKGMAGTIETDWGDVGSFKQDNAFRKWLWEHRKECIGKIIQVAYREITKDKKLKFPRLVRLRDDKDYEDIPNISA